MNNLEEEALKFKNEFLEEHEDGIDRFDIEDIFIAGAEWQKEQLIDKACKWLEEHLLDYWQQSVTDSTNFVNDFHKAMEE